MPKRTLGLETIRARPGHNRKKQFEPLTNVDGHDLLLLFRAWAAELDRDTLVDRDRGRYLTITDIRPTGRTVVIDAESGYFGEAGKTFDVDTHTVTHERGSNQSATINTRVALTVPPGSEIGVFGVERQGILGAGRIVSEFKHALVSRFPTYSFDTETVTEAAAWVEGANLLALRVTATSYTRPADLGDGLEALPTNLGRLELELAPKRGEQFLPSALFQALRAKDLEAADVIGFKGADIDESFVTVSKDGRKKTFELGNEKVPAFRVLLNDDRAPSLTPVEFLRRCQEEVRDYYEEMGLTWNSSWQDGQWSTADLSVTMAPAAAE